MRVCTQCPVCLNRFKCSPYPNYTDNLSMMCRLAEHPSAPRDTLSIAIQTLHLTSIGILTGVFSARKFDRGASLSFVENIAGIAISIVLSIIYKTSRDCTALL